MNNTCGHCEDGQISKGVLCPCCWGTTVSPKALAEARAELDRIRLVYQTKRTANKKLRGRARGMGGYELSKVGSIGRALKAEIDRIERQVAVNRQMARMLGAAAEAAEESAPS